MAELRITDSYLKTLPVLDRDQRIRVAPNLYLRIRENGSRSWWVRQTEKQSGKKKKKRSFDPIPNADFPAMPLAKAVKEAARLTGSSVNASITTEDAVKTYRERHISTLRKATQRSTGYYLDALVAYHGRRKLAGLTRADYVAVAESYRARGKRPSANRCKSAMHAFCAFAVDQGWIEANPMQGMRRQTIGGKETARTRTLSEGEIKWLWNQSPSNHRRLFRVLLLTGCRIGEARAATWSMVQGDADAAVLVLPAEIVKSKRTHTVPLSAMALQVLGPRGKDHEAIFEFAGNSTVHAALDRTGVTFTPHDIRRTVATLLSKLGVLPHVIERVLNHAEPKLVQVYNRYDSSPRCGQH